MIVAWIVTLVDNLNNVGMAFWALQTMLIPQPFILTGVAEDEFSLLFPLVGHIMS